MKREPLSWLFWHPHQGLCNARLLRFLRRAVPVRPLYLAIAGAILVVDTAILWVRVLARRVRLFGPAGLLARTRLPADTCILYFDLGTHRQARELSWMVDHVLPRLGGTFRAFGFEACQEFYEEARAGLAGRDHVQLVHLALSYGLPANARLRLYRQPGRGLTTSLYRPEFGAYEEVDAMHFSDWVRAAGLHLQDCVCLLRMNIEGAEFDVVQDLLDHDLARYIDGYYGRWDDVGKIDMQRDEEMRALLAREHIWKLPFCGADMKFGLRKSAIAYDVRTSARAGLRRLQNKSEIPNSRL